MPRYIDADALIAFIKANGYVYANTLESFVVDDASPDRDRQKARAEAAEARAEALEAERDEAIDAINEKCSECGFYGEWRQCGKCPIASFKTRDMD